MHPGALLRDFFTRHWAPVLFCIVLSVFVLIRGISVPPGYEWDAALYLIAGENIFHGRGIVYGYDPYFTLGMYPPLYPMLISAGMFLGMDPLQSGYLIVQVSLALTIPVLFLLCRELGNDLIGYAVTLIFTFSYPMFEYGYFFGIATEGPFLLFSLLSLLLFVIYVKRNYYVGILLFSGIFAALAGLVKYVGAVVGIAGIIALFLLFKKYDLKRSTDLFLFGTIALGPPAAVVLNNFALSGSNTWIFSNKPVYQLSNFLSILGSTFTHQFYLNNIPVVFFLVVVAGMSVYLSIRYRTSLIGLFQARSKLLLHLILYLLLYFIVICSFTFRSGAVSFPRYFAMILPLIILVALILVQGISSFVRSDNTKRVFILLVGILIGLFLVFNAVDLHQFYTKSSDGLGFSDPAWKNDDAIGWIKNNTDEHTLILTNREDTAYLLKRNLVSLPYRTLGTDQIASFIQSMPRGSIIVVYQGNKVSGLKALLLQPGDLLEEEYGLEKIISFSDSTIYRIAGESVPIHDGMDIFRNMTVREDTVNITYAMSGVYTDQILIKNYSGDPICVKNTGYIQTSGWIFDKSSGRPIGDLYLVVNETVVLPAKTGLLRLDVANYFHNPDLKGSGFSVSFPAASLPGTDNSILFYVVDPNHMSYSIKDPGILIRICD